MDSIGEVTVGEPLSKKESSQFTKGLDKEHQDHRIPEQVGKINYLKIDFALDYLKVGARERNTDGQRAMVTMMASPLVDNVTETNELKVIPAGVAIGFKAEAARSSTESPYMALMDQGSIVITSPVEYDGKMSYVGANRDGVFLIQPAENTTEKSLHEIMRNKFDSVGDQEDGFLVESPNVEMANPKNWEGVKILPIEDKLADLAIKTAIEDASKTPFISSADYQKGENKRKKLQFPD